MLEPFMLVTGMVHHQVHEQFHAALMASLDQILDICDRAIFGGDGLVVGNIISHVDLGRFVRGAEPDDIYTQLLDVIQLGDDSRDIADTVIVGVFERSGPDLVNRCFLPPGSVDFASICHGWCCTVSVGRWRSRKRELSPRMREESRSGFLGPGNSLLDIRGDAVPAEKS